MFFIKKIFVILIIVFLNNINVNSQEYNNALGLRGGFSQGISFKHFLSESDAVEVIAATQYKGLLVTGLYQKYADAFDVPGLQWYYGAGGNLGLFGKDHPKGWFDDGESNIVIGVNVVIGLDYKIEEIPISIAVDIMPRINIIGYFGATMGAGLSVRYIW